MLSGYSSARVISAGLAGRGASVIECIAGRRQAQKLGVRGLGRGPVAERLSSGPAGLGGPVPFHLAVGGPSSCQLTARGPTGPGGLPVGRSNGVPPRAASALMFCCPAADRLPAMPRTAPPTVATLGA